MADSTPRERQLEQLRCGVCGVIHPFLTVCPFIEEREVRIEVNRAAGTRARIERTRYFPRPEIFKAIPTAEDDKSAAPRKERVRRCKA